MPGPQNKSVTITASTAVVYSLQVTRDVDNPAGPITAQIFGRVSTTDPLTPNKQLVQPPFVLTGGFETTFRTLMDGAALTRLRTVEGIEAP